MIDYHVTYEDIVLAADRVAAYAHRTPVLSSSAINQIVNNKIFFKCENFQKVGAFKFRGAINALSQLEKGREVLTYSSGNHAQAVALAAQLLSLKSHIIMPQDAPEIKKKATKGYGANVILYDKYRTAREELAAQMAAEQGYIIVPPYDHPHIIAGQGTATRELMQEVPNLDMVVAPCGGGGLLSGAVTVAKHFNNSCQVIGVEPELADDACRSFHSKTLQTAENPNTIADGLRTPFLGKYTFPIIRDKVDGMLTVSEDDIVAAMKLIYERMKIVVEPSGAVPLAALLNKKISVENKNIGIVISGGNVDLATLGKLF